MNRYYLGLFGGQGPNPAAALLKNNKLIAFAEEERFLRIKNADSRLPVNSIKFCLNKAKIKLTEVNRIGFAWKCKEYKKNVLNNENIKFNNKNKISSYYNLSHNKKLSLGFDDVLINENLKFQLKKLGEVYDKKKITFLDHHKCHAASAFYCSGFKDSSILVMDGSGEFTTTSFWVGKNDKLKKILQYKLPDSIGGVYATFTEFLGFKSDSEEGKLMGLAPYGKFSKKIQEKINRVININEKKLDYKVNPQFRFFGKRTHNNKFTDKFVKLFGRPRLKNDIISSYHQDLAFNIQWKLETLSKLLVKKLIYKTKINNLCLAGGVAMNCKMNGEISKMSEVKNIFVQPAASDNGTALGAAYLVALKKVPNIKIKLDHLYYGPKFSNNQILKSIKETKLKYKYVKNIEKDIAKEIYKGKIVAWFQGAAEFGARALGGRSILADPTNKNMKNKLNIEVKHRENWRPFCPSINSYAFKKYFDIENDCSYMIMATKIKKKFRDILPSVVHIDGTVRPQNVKYKNNKKYFNLIREFEKLSGHPVILNTSFNIQGEPIVNSPQDAIRCFSGTGIDIIVLENYKIEK